MLWERRNGSRSVTIGNDIIFPLIKTTHSQYNLDRSIFFYANNISRFAIVPFRIGPKSNELERERERFRFSIY